MSNAAEESVEISLFQKREKIYPRQVSGLFAQLRIAGILALLGIYYIVPWINYEGRQAVLFDLPHRKFYIFDWIFWPQDFIYLACLLVVAALSLFLFTALAGRLWCGYACPQTVWTEVFLWIERKIEGDRPKQIKLDKAPWDKRKYMIKGSKHAVWITFALFTGFTFVGFFTPIREFSVSLLTFDMGPWETFWLFFYSFATYGNAGWMREQVCMYMCPYARFQSAMFDDNTLIVTYDSERGEGRGSRKKGEDYKAKGLGDCIDCTMCVQVCPTGIDIRNGLQYECIGCAACIDVCDSVMEKMDYPKGLIRYSTENAMQGAETKIIRPRVIVYSIMIIGFLASIIYGIEARVPAGLDIIRDRNMLFRENYEGMIENIYTIKLLNMDTKDHEYKLSVSGMDSLDIADEKRSFKVPAGEVIEVPIVLSADPADMAATSQEIQFKIEARDNPEIIIRTPGSFIGPLQ